MLDLPGSSHNRKIQLIAETSQNHPRLDAVMYVKVVLATNRRSINIKEALKILILTDSMEI